MILGYAVSLMVALAGAAPPVDDAPLPWTLPMAGDWTLAGVSEGDPYCRVTLGSDAAIGGASIDVSATCLRNFPFDEVAAWTLRDDRIALIDPLRQPVLLLERVPDGAWTGTLADGRQLVFDRGAPAQPESRQALLDGTFVLSGANDRARCGFSIAAASDDAGTLEQVGDCPGLWASMRWTAWRFADGQLQLLDGDGGTLLSLAPADGYTFVAERDDGPLYFGPGAVFAARDDSDPGE